MCRFSFKARLCGCEDRYCTQQTSALDRVVNERGHVLSITEYRRDSAMCMGWFQNYHSNRVVLEYGLREDSLNSKQDCWGRKDMIVREDMERQLEMCAACERNCTQPKVSPKIVDELGTTIIMKNVPLERKCRKKMKLAEELTGIPFRRNTETREEREQRHERYELYDLEMSRGEGYHEERQMFDILELLYDYEWREVIKRAKKITEELPEKRRFERAKERMGGLYFAKDELEDKGEHADTRFRGAYILPK